MGGSRGRSIRNGNRTYRNMWTDLALASILVRSFISTFGGPKNNASGKLNRKSSNNASPVETPPRWQTPSPDTPSPPSEFSPVGGSTPRDGEIGSRPASMIFSNNPPLMAQVDGTPPELSPIFSFLNIHTNKVYHEGYFLKLNDQDNRMCDVAAVRYRHGLTRSIQMGGRVLIGSGWNVMLNLLGQFFHYGMPLRWTELADKRSRRPLSTSQTRRLKWYLH